MSIRVCTPHNSSKTCSNHRIGEVSFLTFKLLVIENLIIVIYGIKLCFNSIKAVMMERYTLSICYTLCVMCGYNWLPSFCHNCVCSS